MQRGLKMVNRICSVAAFIFVALGILSCSRDGAPVPTVPVPQSQEVSSYPSPGSSHSLWDYELITIDPTTLQFETAPVRDIAAHYNILSWLEQSPCTNCFKLVSVKPSGNGTLLCDIRIKHPFPSLNLTGFDVRGICMFQGSYKIAGTNIIMSDKSKGEAELVNANGFTELYNPTTSGDGPGGLQGYIKGKLAIGAPNCTLNGFKRFVSNKSGNTRNAFYAGDTIDETFEIVPPNRPILS